MTLKIQLPSTKLIKGNTSQLPRYSYIKQKTSSYITISSIFQRKTLVACTIFHIAYCNDLFLLRIEERFISFKRQICRKKKEKKQAKKKKLKRSEDLT
jgi:hypothetical protein